MQLAPLQHLYNHDGPFISLHLDVSRTTEDAAHRLDAQWQTARSDLADAGAGEEILERLGELMREPAGVAGEARRSVVATDSEVLFDDVCTGHGGWREICARGPLPDLTGWVAQVDGEIPFVLVTADREGADVDLYTALSKPPEQHAEVQGETLHITKVPQGDWAQKQFQRRSEQVWRHNAREVADVVRHLWAEHKPRVVVLAGDVRARTEVSEALRHGGDLTVAEVEGGGRAAGSSTDALWRDVNGVLAQITNTDRDQLTDSLGAGSGQGRDVCRGLPDVLGALVRGQVDRLLVDLDALEGQTISPRDYPGLMLPAGAAEGHRLPAHQVLVAGGAGTDAQLSLLPADVTHGDGVAALLRW